MKWSWIFDFGLQHARLAFPNQVKATALVKDNGKPFSMGTRLTQLGRTPDTQYGFVNGPVHRGLTEPFKTIEDLEQSRDRLADDMLGTPTIENLENAWAEIAGAAGTVLSP